MDEVSGLKDGLCVRRGIVVGWYTEEGSFEMLLRNNAPDDLFEAFFFLFCVAIERVKRDRCKSATSCCGDARCEV